jgi:hypothetical protein
MTREMHLSRVRPWWVKLLLPVFSASLITISIADAKSNSSDYFVGQNKRKHRLLILTDIGGDPDDQQSMIRLLLYANEFDLEGLIDTSTRSQINPDEIRMRIEAYRKVRPNLVKHAEDYPPG